MLALICGQGALPRLIAESCTKPPLIACLAQFPPDDLTPDVEFRLETLGSFLEQLKELGTTQVCFAGAIRRPDIDQTFIDPATEALVPLIATALAQGDDGALMIVIEIFEQYGFMVVGVDHIAPELVPPVSSRRAPTIAVVPLTATDLPNWSPSALSLARIFWTSDQADPLCSKM